MNAASKKTASPGRQTFVSNRKARYTYQVLDDVEAGLELLGTEVKSIREAKVSIDEAFADIQGRQIFLQQMRIEPYSHGNQFNHDPVRPRRLLLHKEEILKLIALTQQKGYTLVPLDLHLTHGKIKVKLGICKGKQQSDKRETLKKRTSDREAQRAISNARKRA